MLLFLHSFYYFNTLFIKLNSPWLIFESVKTLGIKTSILFNLSFSKILFIMFLLSLFLVYFEQFLILAST